MGVYGKMLSIIFVAGLIIASLLGFFSYASSVLAGYTEGPPTSEGVGVSIIIGSPGGGGGGGSPISRPGDISFAGKAFPGAFVTISMNGSVSATFLAESDGTFSHKLTGIPSGVYTFSISAEDSDGRDSVTLSLNLNIAIGSLTEVSGLFFPPTLSVSETTKKGEDVVMEGQGFPNANVFLFIEPGGIVKEAKIDPDGRWSYNLNTSGFNPGTYKVRTRAVTDIGEQSEMSQEFSFSISLSDEDEDEDEDEPDEGECGRADYNCDGFVNFRDVSILMHYWFENSERADLNGDGFIDHVDFSILMYYWTG